MDLVCLLCDNISGTGIFSRPSLGPNHNPGFLFSLFGSFPFDEFLYDVLIPKTKVLRHFSLCFS